MPAPDPKIILQHLELLVAPAIGTALSDGLIEIAFGQVRPVSAHMFPLGELDQAVAFAARVNAAGNQVWIGAALRRPDAPISKRAGKAQFYGSFWLWMDDAADWAKAATAAADCPPDAITCTGTVPAWRGQYLWRLIEPITDPVDLETLTRGIRDRLGGEDVANADRLIRLAGTVNWPTKPGRTEAELATWRWANGAASATDTATARRVYAGAPAKPRQTTASPRNVVGQVDLERAILEARKPGKWHATVRDLVAHLVGSHYPDAGIKAICRRCEQGGAWTPDHERELDKLIEGARSKFGEDTFDKVDQPAEPEPPLPLLREMPPATCFPISALGSLLGDAAHGIVDMIQVPAAMAAQSVLGAAALAVQAHVDITLPTEQTRPTSLYLISLGVTGDRKDSCDREALWPVRQREIELEQLHSQQMPEWLKRHRIWKAQFDRIAKIPDTVKREAELSNLGLEPDRPLEPDILCEEPTIEGLTRSFLQGQPAMGLFSTEGGQFIGGYSMADNQRVHTGGQLSKLWDAGVIKRIRGGEDTARLRGRRLSVHLMIQPAVATLLLADPMMEAQGLLSRLLVSAPDSLRGTRLWKDPAPESDQAVKAYGGRLLLLLEDPPPMATGKRNQLDPRILRLSPAARTQWIAFADDVERQLATGRDYQPISGLANKLAENAARLAAVLTVVDQPQVGEVSAAYLDAGIELARYYAAEALRLHGASDDSPDMKLAARLYAWLEGQVGEVTLRHICRNGPPPTRPVEVATRVMAILEARGYAKRAGRALSWEIVS